MAKNQKEKTSDERIRKRVLWLPDSVSARIYISANDLDEATKEKFWETEKLVVRPRAKRIALVDRPGLIYRSLDLPGAAQLCVVAGLSLKDLLAEEGLVMDWPTQEAKDLDARISRLPEERQLQLKSIVMELSAPCFITPEESLPSTPTDRLEWLMTRIETRVAKGLRLTYVEVRRDSKVQTGAQPDVKNLAELLQIATELKICPQFLTCMISDSVAMLSASPISEYTVVLWSFLSAGNRLAVTHMVDMVEEEVKSHD